MRRRKKADEKDAQILALTKLLEERNARICALQTEIRSLRDVVATINVNPRFWIGLPIGLVDKPWNCNQPEKRHKHR